MFSATMKMAELFYTRNGVPITEDKTLNFENRYSTRKAVDSERYVINPDCVTARLNFDRNHVSTPTSVSMAAPGTCTAALPSPIPAPLY